jgi:GPH family glycoside/pentoside/hexuronide:cation symporter
MRSQALKNMSLLKTVAIRGGRKMNLFKKDLSGDAKLSIAERSAYGLGNVGSAFIYAAIATFLLFYYTDVVGLNAGIIGTIFLASRIFDGITDVAMGFVIDRTKSKHGKARVWILRSIVPYAIASVLLFSVPSGWSSAAQYIFVFVSYNLLNTFAYTAMSMAYNSMNALMTTNQYERGLLGIFAMFGSTFGQMVVNSFTLQIVAGFGNTKAAWTIAFAIFATIAMIFHFIMFFATSERVANFKEDAQEKISMPKAVKSLIQNKYWLMMTACYVLIMIFSGLVQSFVMYYSTVTLGDVKYQPIINNATMLPMLIALLMAFAFIKKFGKGKTFLIGTTVLLVAFVARAFAGANPMPQIVISIVHGFGQGLASSVLLGIVADTVEYGLWKTGVRLTGTLYAVSSFAAKISNGLGVAIVGWLLAWAGYRAGEAATSKVLFAINAGFIYMPLAISAIIFVIMMFYKLDDEYPQIIEDLKKREEKNEV